MEVSVLWSEILAMSLLYGFLVSLVPVIQLRVSYFPCNSIEKRPRHPDLLAKIAIIQVLESEIQVLLQANNLQKQEIENLQQVAAAQEKEWQEFETKIANGGGDRKQSQHKVKTCESSEGKEKDFESD